MRREDVESANSLASGVFRAPVFPDDPTLTRRARALHSVVLTAFAIVVLIFTVGIPFIFKNGTAAAIFGGVIALVALASAWMGRGYVNAGSWTLTASWWLIVTTVTLLGGGLASIAPMGYLAVVTTGIWLLGRRGGLILAVATVLAGLAIAVASAQDVPLPRILTIRPLSSWLYLIFAVAGAALPMVLAIRDLKEALREAKRSRAVTDTIVDHIPGIFSMLDHEGRLLRFNSRLSEITGIPSGTLFNMPARLLVAEREQEAATTALRQCLDEGTAICELSIRTADGSLAPHLFYGARLTHDGSLGAVVIGLDLQERRQAELALRRFEERYRDFLERVYFAAITMDLELKLEFANEYFEHLSGWSRSELIGEPFLRFVDDSDRPSAMESLESILRGGETLVVAQTKLMARDGRPRIVQWNISPIVSPEGAVRGVTCLGVDLTERHLLEAQLIQAQKLESLGRLAAGVAHDFNNILTVISGFAEVLQSRPGESEQHAHAVGEIVSASRRAAALTRQLLAFSRRQVLTPQIVDLNALLLESRQMLDRLIGAGIRIQTSIEDGVLNVLADPGQLHQVIMNLAVNSRDAMPDGGTLTLSTSSCGGFHQLAVADTGHGMDEATCSRAFEPFFTTKEPGQGSGLGLAMVYGIIDQSQGSVHIESSVGLGTVVTLRLPAASGDPTEEIHAVSEPAGRPVRILLAEDESGVRDLVALILKDAGHFVIPAEDGPTALEEAERAEFNFDAAVVDVVMPYMSGPELVTQLRHKLPDLPVVFISGYSHTPPALIQGSSSRTEYVQKPFQTDQLLTALHRVLHV